MTVLVLGFEVLFADASRPLLGQVFLAVTLAVTVMSGLALIWVLDRPFADRGAQITSADLSGAIAAMIDLDPTAAVPCDASGRPTAS
jgi:hypothetical protein